MFNSVIHRHILHMLVVHIATWEHSYILQVLFMVMFNLLIPFPSTIKRLWSHSCVGNIVYVLHNFCLCYSWFVKFLYVCATVYASIIGREYLNNRSTSQ